MAFYTLSSEYCLTKVAFNAFKIDLSLIKRSNAFSFESDCWIFFKQHKWCWIFGALIAAERSISNLAFHSYSVLYKLNKENGSVWQFVTFSVG